MTSRANFAGDATGGGGKGNPESPGLGHVLGFVTEFNQNVLIFGVAVDLLLGLYNQVDDMQKFQTSSALYSLMMLDPEGYADVMSQGDIPDTADKNARYERVKGKALSDAQGASPVYALETRMAALEGVLGVSAGSEGEDEAQANPLDELRDAIQAAQREAITFATRADGHVLQAAISEATRSAVAQATAAIAVAIANLRNGDATNQPANHNREPKWSGGQ